MFSSSISQLIAQDRVRELRGAALSRRREATPPDSAAGVTIRLARPADREGLDRLAQLDSRPVPAGELVVAEVAGQVRAAMAVAGGAPIADPFHPTLALTSLLALRARQLRDAPVPVASRPRRLVALPNR